LVSNRTRDAWLAHAVSLVLAFILVVGVILARTLRWELHDDVTAVVVVVAVTSGLLWLISVALAVNGGQDEFPNPEQLLMATVVEFILGLILVGWLF
jgi:hypothetical protein